jgi:tagatose 1,6-diphosphate aldolase/sulfofructosephosphate aldolase
VDLTLDRIAGPGGTFAILAMDQRGTLRSMLDKAGQPTDDAALSAFKVDVIGALSPYASGVLTDVEYGVGPVRAAGALHERCGLIVASERSPQPRTEYDAAGRGPRFVADHGGVALKFLVRWWPDAAGTDLDVIRRVVEDCRAQGMPSVIEPLVRLAPEDDAAAGHRLVIRSAGLLAELRPDLLKLEWPGDGAGCAELTKVCGPVPWTLLSAGVAYDAFVERTLVALDAGASGYIAGRAFWGEAAALTGAERRQFLREVAAKRMTDLNAAIAGRGRPWTGGCRYT